MRLHAGPLLSRSNFEFGNIGFQGGRKIEVPNKKSSEQEVNQHQTQSRTNYDAEAGIRTWSKLGAGKCPHRCVIPAPQLTVDVRK